MLRNVGHLPDDVKKLQDVVNEVDNVYQSHGEFVRQVREYWYDPLEDEFSEATGGCTGIEDAFYYANLEVNRYYILTTAILNKMQIEKRISIVANTLEAHLLYAPSIRETFLFL